MSKGKPLYLAIADALERDRETGKLAPGSPIPPQRELAEALDVNLSTITRAFAECHRRGLIMGTVGRGTVVTGRSEASLPGVSELDTESGLIEMGVVLPLYSCEQEIETQIRRTINSKDMGRYLRYVPSCGLLEHREAGSIWMRRSGIDADPARVLVTCGSQNALAVSMVALFRAGDRIAVDELTYPGISTLASLYAIRLVPIPIDREGMDPEELDIACKRHTIRGLYLMPRVQNPTTSRISPDRRERIIAVIRRHGLVLIEDDAYGFTAEDRDSVPALSAQIPEAGVFVAGVSKALGAGLRASFLYTPERFRPAIEKALLGMAWMASPLSAAIVSDAIRSKTADSVVTAKRAETKRRSLLAAHKLAAFQPRFRTHGLFLWLDLPEEWTGRQFELAAREAGVRVFGAERFVAGERCRRPGARISLTGAETLESLSKGLDTVCHVLAGRHPKMSVML